MRLEISEFVGNMRGGELIRDLQMFLLRASRLKH